MTQYSIGDLSQSFLTRVHGVRLKAELQSLTEQLGSGSVSDVGAALQRDLGYFAHIEGALRQFESLELSAREAASFTDATQTALDRISGLLEQSTPEILSATSTQIQKVRVGASRIAQNDIEAVVGALNTSIAGRSLFSGTATDQTPLIDPSSFLTTVKSALPAISDAATLISEVGLFFSSGGGFDTTLYSGSVSYLKPVRISQDENVQIGLRADASEFKAVLEGLTIAALATDPSLALSPADQTTAFDHAANVLISAQTGVIGLQSQTGALQERIDSAQTYNASIRLGLEETRTELVGADELDVATRLEDVQFRLEALFAVTARLSNLSLVNFI